MTQYQIDSCPICESIRIGEGSLKCGDRISQCSDCHFMFLNPQPSDDILNKIYSKNYFIGEQTSEDKEYIHEMKRKTTRLYLKKLILYCKGTKGKLFELGCGNGYFLVEAKASGFEVEAIEINERAVRIANARLGGECVRSGNIEKMEYPIDCYDVCVLIDILEHTRNPIALLEKVYNSLKLGGVVFIVVPSLDNWSVKFLKGNWMEFKTEHLQYFSKKTIQYALKKVGFSRIELEPNVKSLTLDYISMHFQMFKVPFLSFFLSCIVNLLPRYFKYHTFYIKSSSINVLCRKPKQ